MHRLLLLLLLVPSAMASNVLISLDYMDDDNITVVRSVYVPYNLSKEMKISEYRFETFLVDSTVLDSGHVIIPGPIFVEESEEMPAEVFEKYVKRIDIVTDYDDRISHLVLKRDKELLRIDLMHLNRCDLDGICGENENVATCAEDCHDTSEDGLCLLKEDGICEEDADCAAEDIDCREPFAKNVSLDHASGEDAILKEEIDALPLIWPIAACAILIITLYLMRRRTGKL